MKIRVLLILFFVIFPYYLVSSQDKPKELRLGFDFATGNQQTFPFNNSDYYYKIKGYKIIINRTIRTGTLSLELQFEPSIYSTHHQLLNQYFIQPDFGSDYLLQRERFTKKQRITDITLNTGIIARFNISDRWSTFLLGSIGPMITNTATERLAKGFAFCDIVALGVGYRVHNIMFELRPGLRHVSNLNFQFPNSGLNSTTIDFGISVKL